MRRATGHDAFGAGASNVLPAIKQARAIRSCRVKNGERPGWRGAGRRGGGGPADRAAKAMAATSAIWERFDKGNTSRCAESQALAKEYRGNLQALHPACTRRLPLRKSPAADVAKFSLICGIPIRQTAARVRFGRCFVCEMWGLRPGGLDPRKATSEVLRRERERFLSAAELRRDRRKCCARLEARASSCRSGHVAARIA